MNIYIVPISPMLILLYSFTVYQSFNPVFISFSMCFSAKFSISTFFRAFGRMNSNLFGQLE